MTNKLNGAQAPVEVLLDEVRQLFHLASQAAETLHAEEAVTVGMRAVLEYLDRRGASTVPDIARERHVSRQHVQTLVNALLEQEMVEQQDNPAHKRSCLIALSPEGLRAIKRMRGREARHLAALPLDLSEAELQRTCRALAKVRAAIGASS